MSLRSLAGPPRPVGLRRSSRVGPLRLGAAMAVTDARMIPVSKAAGAGPRRGGATAASNRPGLG